MQLKNPSTLLCRPLCFGCAAPEYPFSVAQHISTDKSRSLHQQSYRAQCRTGIFSSWSSLQSAMSSAGMDSPSRWFTCHEHHSVGHKPQDMAREICGWAITLPSSSLLQPCSESNSLRLSSSARAHPSTPAGGWKQEFLHHKLNQAKELGLKQFSLPRELDNAQDGDVHYVCMNGGWDEG